jgi:hypothetical protein
MQKKTCQINLFFFKHKKNMQTLLMYLIREQISKYEFQI